MFYNFSLKIGTTQCLLGVNHDLEEGGKEFLSKSVEGSWMLRFSLLCGSLIFCPFLCFCRIISFKVYIFLMHRYLCICTHIYKGGPGLFIRFPESVCTGVYSSDFLFLVSLQMYCSTGSDKWKAQSYEIYENRSYELLFIIIFACHHELASGL